jgi:hypothetical protein
MRTRTITFSSEHTIAALRARFCTAGIAMLCVAFVLLATGSQASAAGTPYVDGISDQSIPTWDSGFSNSYFTGYFASHWITGGHIKYARYVVQWDVMTETTKGANPKGDYRERFEAWYSDASSLGLTLDVGLARYTRALPASSSEYETRLSELLAAFPKIAVVEAWNEPNNTAGLNGEAAAHFTNSAYALCELHHSCTVIAADFLDKPELAAYEKEYNEDLNPANPPNWGIHPYYAIKNRSETSIIEFEANMPGKGAGDQIWFTEAGAYRCEDFSGKREEFSEESQAGGAYWLTNILMKNIQPAHVFYYEFLAGEHQPPPCTETDADTALYVPSNDPNAPDRPRAAAAYIFGNKGLPWGYTGAPSNVETRKATLTASIYPGGKESEYYFEYGTSTSYGRATAHTATGIHYGLVEAAAAITGLASETTYHYRVVATNLEGTTAGEDKTFTTPQFAVQATPNPAEPAAGNSFSDVSCGSAKSCVAIGNAGPAPLASSWNGTTWTQVTAPPLPEGETSYSLTGVSCWSTKGCIVVGHAVVGESRRQFADEWNGTSWSYTEIPAAPGTQANTDEFTNVSCVSAKACTVVGSAKVADKEIAPIAAHWNGKVWTSEVAVLPEGANLALFDSVSCTSTTSCIAVGYHLKIGGKELQLSEEWNGSRWKVLPSPTGTERVWLYAVSCTSSTACTAVGTSYGPTAVIERYDGKKWTVEATAGIAEEELVAVSCASATVCTATGSTHGVLPSRPIAERREGGAWTALPAALPGGTKEGSLVGVSCPSTGTCVAAGYSEAELFGPGFTLAEVY